MMHVMSYYPPNMPYYYGWRCPMDMMMDGWGYTPRQLPTGNVPYYGGMGCW